ncbi:hypothetical protein BRADI_2g47037v3 [Brachypodium distachyon]|uniref:Wall-associated receptor kinase galacturonan-binding domain-containing protein n=1 Tax=Brachypodium distachyon TaxID=15368 RepID=A0A2K2DE89_BRADI|nr:hypothetical protein BRADI_2g47037v3 [Brachypodium distachyon]
MAPLLLLPVLLLFATAADGYPSTCRNATCGQQTIAYPFWLNSSSSSSASSCGYPGLGLACEDGTTLIFLAQSHRYKVSNIDYETHTIALADADAFTTTTGCPLLDFNLTIDTISALQLSHADSNITFFYNCTKNSWSSAVELSGCPQYNKSSYVSPADDYDGEASEFGCEAAVVAPVLEIHKKGIVGVGSPPATKYVEVLRAGFELNYSPNSDQCGRCERSRGWCGYRHNQTHGGIVFSCFCDGGPTADHCGKCPSSSSPALLEIFLASEFGFQSMSSSSFG